MTINFELTAVYVYGSKNMGCELKDKNTKKTYNILSDDYMLLNKEFGVYIDESKKVKVPVCIQNGMQKPLNGGYLVIYNNFKDVYKIFCENEKILSDSKLKLKYHYLNEDYFNNELPTNTVIKYSKSLEAIISKAYYLSMDEEGSIIQIDLNYDYVQNNISQLDDILLKEMIKIKFGLFISDEEINEEFNKIKKEDKTKADN